MIPVYQTIVDPGKGNCLQAAVASLVELPLDQVPPFIELKDPWIDVLRKWLPTVGHCFVTRLHNPSQLGWAGEWEMEERLMQYRGVKGFYLASVLSPKYFSAESYCIGAAITHAVLIDQQYNVVHDPNPEYNKGDMKYPLHAQLGINGVITVTIIQPT